MSVRKALAALAKTPPRQYLQRADGNSTTGLQDLFEQCVNAGLLPASAGPSDDISKLHALFDVALDHGMGSLLLDYVVDVCSDRLLTSSDPVAAFLMDGECVRRWCHKTLAISKGRLTSWLGRGLGFISSSGTLPRELAKLRALQQVVQALSPAASATAASVAGELPTQQAQQQEAPPEVAEVARLIQCGKVLAWLSQAGGKAAGFERPTGRFASEQEWRGLARKRQDGAAPATVFVADTLAALAQEGVPGLQYPQAGLERLVGSLFLSGATSQAAWQLKLSLLTYWLVDGGFLKPQRLAKGLGDTLQIPKQLSLSWVLRLLLDDAYAPEHAQQVQQAGPSSGNGPLAQAAALLPEVDGSALPFKALQVFLAHGDPSSALALLRQRGGAGGGGAQRAQQQQGQQQGAGAGSSSALHEASVAVAILTEGGLLAEAYMEVKNHLGALEGQPEQRLAHAEALVGQLLGWGLQRGNLHAIIRLPLGAVEEQVACSWLAEQAVHYPQCGLILSLFYLLRGRTPEALLAYAQHCPPGGEASNQVQAHLAELLRQAGRSLPSVQRALVLRYAPAPAVHAAGGAALMSPEEVGGAQAPIPLASTVPGLSIDGQASIVSEGPTPLEAPLVGSIPALLALKQWQQAQREGAVADALAPGEGRSEGASSPAAFGSGPGAGTSAGAVQAPGRQLFQAQAPVAAGAQQAQQAVPPRGFLSGSQLGTAAPGGAGPAKLARFGGGAWNNGGFGRAGASAASLAVGSQQQLQDGVVGEREFDRMLGLAGRTPAGGRAQRLGAVRLARQA